MAVCASVWGAVRGMCDTRAETGQFILTGSATPADGPHPALWSAAHSAAGPAPHVANRARSVHSGGIAVWAAERQALRRDPTGKGVPEAVDALCRGGWPGLDVDIPARDAIRILRSYLDDIARTDIRQVDGVARDPVRVRALLHSLARNVGTTASLNKLAAEASAATPLSRHTVRSYLDALERLHVLEPLTAWPAHLRSRSPLLTSPKHHFTDPSLAVAALRAHPDRLLRDPEALGLLFESLVIRDLRIYAQACDAEVYTFVDAAGTEADAIIDTGDGRWIAVEVKLGGHDHIERAARSLLAVRRKIDESKMGQASKLVVITAADGYAYERPDGISVTPFFALGPLTHRTTTGP